MLKTKEPPCINGMPIIQGTKKRHIIVVTCRGCSTRYRASSHSSKYCSRECRSKNRKPLKIGECRTINVTRGRIVPGTSKSQSTAMLEARLKDTSSPPVIQESFYRTEAWLRLRYFTLLKYRKCLLCGSKDNLHVDHIKPRSKRPELSLDANNLQVLCRDCNLGKSNLDSTDFRLKE